MVASFIIDVGVDDAKTKPHPQVLIISTPILKHMSCTGNQVRSSHRDTNFLAIDGLNHALLNLAPDGLYIRGGNHRLFLRGAVLIDLISLESGEPLATEKLDHALFNFATDGLYISGESHQLLLRAAVLILESEELQLVGRIRHVTMNALPSLDPTSLPAQNRSTLPGSGTRPCSRPLT